MQLSSKPCSDTEDINLLGNEKESLFIIYKSPYFVVLLKMLANPGIGANNDSHINS